MLETERLWKLMSLHQICPSEMGVGGKIWLEKSTLVACDEEMTNLFADLSLHLPDELVTTLLEAVNVRIERIVSHGHVSPDGFWYDQDQHEWVIVLRGAARIRFEDRTIEMKPGDFVNIPAHQKHRVEWTTPAESTIWLAVFYGEAATE